MSRVSDTSSNFDAKAVFNYYFELGTLQRVVELLAKQGVVNPNTLKPYTTAWIERGMYNYIINYPDEVRETYIAHNKHFATNDEQWNRFLVSKAMSIYGKKKFLEWIERIGFSNKYEYMYAEWYGIQVLPETQWQCQKCYTINEIESQTCSKCGTPMNYVPYIRHRNR